MNKGVVYLKNTKLRVLWIIPNVFLYLMFIGFSSFVAVNAEDLQEINRLGIWVFMMVILFLASVFDSYRIWKWIKEGKM